MPMNTTDRRQGPFLLGAVAAAALLLAPSIVAQTPAGEAPTDDDWVGFELTGERSHSDTSIVRSLPNSTQGPPWPPSEIVDENGDFIVVGLLLEEHDGVIEGVPTPGAIVSKHTVPPLDANGVEDFTNPFSVPYDVSKVLDLSPGSPDNDIVLHTASFGPPIGDFGGVMRIPQEGENQYNLNGFGFPCQELFPSASQATTFTRPQYPLHEVPIPGFRGDGVQYDVDTGDAFDPHNASGSDCAPDGCSGEDEVDSRRRDPITLGEWLEARGRVKISLRGFDADAGGFTQAKVRFRFRDLIPGGLYTVWDIRFNNFFGAKATPIALPNIVKLDDRGRGTIEFLLTNPFPNPADDPAGNRILGFAIAFHPDGQTWGACGDLLGPGVDVLTVFSTIADGNLDISEGMITVPPSGS